MLELTLIICHEFAIQHHLELRCFWCAKTLRTVEEMEANADALLQCVVYQRRREG
jgi:hypothetical protein